MFSILKLRFPQQVSEAEIRAPVKTSERCSLMLVFFLSLKRKSEQWQSINTIKKHIIPNAKVGTIVSINICYIILLFNSFFFNCLIIIQAKILKTDHN